MGAAGVTVDLAQWIARSDDAPPARARRVACQVVLDWVGVTLAGAQDPLVRLLLDEAQAGGSALIIGTASRVGLADAARINGAASHVLDFDDINKRMRGHPTVAILPALLAAADGRSCADVIDALITGTEIACALGEMMGEPHYLHGFHTTATVGTVAAAAGVCRLYRLDAANTARALSIAATQAAGLRAMFGTMVKPLHAGLAAERGLMAARWAGAGMTAPADGIEHPQGFGPVLSSTFAPKAIRLDPADSFGIEANIFKRHAACYYTHSAIEAVAGLMRTDPFKTQDVEAVTIALQAGLHTVCDIQDPATGLEVKFSVRHLVAMVLAGHDTTDPEQFTDDLAHIPELVDLRSRVHVTPLETNNRMEASAQVQLRDGRTHAATCDVSTPAQDLDAQERDLVNKFTRLAQPVLGAPADTLAQRILTMDTPQPIAALLAELSVEH